MFGNKRTTFFLQGGLGNQLHITSAALTYAKMSSKKVRISDLFLSSARVPRNNFVKGLFPELATLEVNVEFHSKRPKKVNLFHSTIFRGLSFLGRRRLFNIIDFGDDFVPLELFEKLRTSHCLGYFQSYNFPNFLRDSSQNFFSIQALETSEFATKNGMDSQVIIVHIRGGDYLEAVNSKFGILDGKYFESAVGRLMQNQIRVRVWVITNDRHHCDEILAETNINPDLVIDENSGLDEFDILAIMVNASNIVISNSTFSWWGGYLASSKHAARVIAPTPWFRELNGNEEYRLPANWELHESAWKN